MQLQYIGARYVPVWYHNSVDDTSNWEVNVEYEPLTFVTSANNHLYLSKKTVPDNIGTPAQNTEYWLDMGTFTGSFAELQDEIDEINDVTIPAVRSDITSLESKVDKNAVKTGLGNALFIGDSYSTISTGYTKALPELLKDLMGFSTIYNYAIAGSGYVNGIGTSQHFGGQLQNAINDTTPEERNNISYVFVLGGQNDYAQSVSDVYTQANNLYTNIKTSFPNAKIVALPLWRDKALSEANATRFTIIYYLANGNGCLTDFHSWAYLIDVYSSTMADGVHPTQETLNHLAGCIKTMLDGGNPIVPATGGILRANRNIGTWYNPIATFDGVNVTIRALLAMTSNVGPNTDLVKIDDTYAPALTIYTNVLRNGSSSVQATLNSGGYLKVNGALNSGEIVSIEFTYPLYGCQGNVGDIT